MDETPHHSANGYPDASTPATTSGALDPKHRAQLETDSGLKPIPAFAPMQSKRAATLPR